MVKYQGRLPIRVELEALTSDDFKRILINKDSRIKEQGFHHGASYLEHLGFLDAIKNKTSPEVTVNDGLMSIVLGIAAQESIATGKLVKIANLIKG